MGFSFRRRKFARIVKEFLEEIKEMKQKNLAFELLKKLINDEM
jgi:hypothetical protein